MKINLNQGDSLKEVFKVKPEDCTSAVDKRLPDLLGTYIVVLWMEIVSAKLAQNSLDDKYITVGQNINLNHLGMATIDEKVSVKSTFISQNKRTLAFKVEVHLGNELIAEAEHKRVVIQQRLIQRQIEKKSSEKSA